MYIALYTLPLLALYGSLHQVGTLKCDMGLYIIEVQFILCTITFGYAND